MMAREMGWEMMKMMMRRAETDMTKEIVERRDF